MSDVQTVYAVAWYTFADYYACGEYHAKRVYLSEADAYAEAERANTELVRSMNERAESLNQRREEPDKYRQRWVKVPMVSMESLIIREDHWVVQPLPIGGTVDAT